MTPDIEHDHERRRRAAHRSEAATPDAEGLSATVRDTTDAEDARRELARSEARYRAVVESTQAGVIALDEQGDTLLANARIAEMMRLPLQDVYSRGLWHLFDPESRERAMQRLLDPDRGPATYVLEVRRGDDTPVTVSAVVTPLSIDGPESSGWLVMAHDVTEERAHAHELRRQALHDPLTGLANRVLLEDRVRMAAARRRRDPGHAISVLYVDVDGLKRVNDEHGHAAGDAFLVEVARRLESAVRESDTVARLGGDEFAVVCEAADAGSARLVADRVRGLLAQPVELDGVRVPAAASIGVATAPPREVEDLVTLADMAMYAAKSGDADVVTYDDRLADASARRSVLRSGLQQALHDGDIGVRHLRVMDLTERSVVVGLDAVPSWRHPDLGPVPSRELIGAARDAGIEADLERHVLAGACRDLRRLRDVGAVPATTRVSVALALGGLMSSDLVAAVGSALREHRLDPDLLELRVAESAMTPGAGGTTATLRTAAELGVGLAVDRFVDEPHSLWKLHTMPFTAMRVEAPRVTAPKGDRRPLLHTVVALADSLGTGVVATEVTTEAQVDLLRRGGVRHGQGLLFGPAVPLEALVHRR